MATFIHTRRFLAYHRDRFRDLSVLLKNEKDQVLGLLPAAIDQQDEHRVVSHPGITFGGVLHAGELYGEKMIEAIESLRSYYAGRGLRSLRYRAIPYIYDRTPSGDDLYALFRLGSSAVPLRPLVYN